MISAFECLLDHVDVDPSALFGQMGSVSVEVAFLPRAQRRPVDEVYVFISIGRRCKGCVGGVDPRFGSACGDEVDLSIFADLGYELVDLIIGSYAVGSQGEHDGFSDDARIVIRVEYAFCRIELTADLCVDESVGEGFEPRPNHLSSPGCIS